MKFFYITSIRYDDQATILTEEQSVYDGGWSDGGSSLNRDHQFQTPAEIKKYQDETPALFTENEVSQLDQLLGSSGGIKLPLLKGQDSRYWKDLFQNHAYQVKEISFSV
jgi:hypothetical protein